MSDKRYLKRQRAWNEVISSEEKYVSDLEALVACFVKPLAAEAVQASQAGRDPLLTPQEHSSIFGPVEQLLTLNRRLLAEMRNEGDQLNIGKLFFTYAPYFKMYGLYASAYTTATNLLSHLKVNRVELEPWLQSSASSPMCRGLRLSDFLIMPVQRVPRYRMLLAEVLKHSDEKDDPQGYKEMKEALEKVKEVASKINEFIAGAEKQMELVKLQRDGFGDLAEIVEPGRHYIMDEMMTKVCRSKNKIYQFFLFSDVVMYASERGSVDKSVLGGQYKLHRIIELKTARLIVDSDKKNAEVFVLQSPKKSFQIICQSNEQKIKWCNAIQQCIDEMFKLTSCNHDGTGNRNGQGSLAPVWQHDEEGKNCSNCKKAFTFLKRRHHCRNCGHLFCNDCSNKKWRLLNISTKPSRVCISCFQKLQHNHFNPGATDAEPGATITKHSSAMSLGAFRPGSNASLQHHASAPPGVFAAGTGPEKITSDPGLLPGWHATKTDDGETYWYNEVSGKTTWDCPTAPDRSKAEMFAPVPQNRVLIRPVTPPSEDEDSDSTKPTQKSKTTAPTKQIDPPRRIQPKPCSSHSMKTKPKTKPRPNVPLKPKGLFVGKMSSAHSKKEMLPKSSFRRPQTIHSDSSDTSDDEDDSKSQATVRYNLRAASIAKHQQKKNATKPPRPKRPPRPTTGTPVVANNKNKEKNPPPRPSRSPENAGLGTAPKPKPKPKRPPRPSDRSIMEPTEKKKLPPPRPQRKATNLDATSGCIPYEVLSDPVLRPKECDRLNLPSYLSTDEFHSVFGVDKKTFESYPAWKQKSQKIKANLF
jgi:hypothetical protein